MRFLIVDDDFVCRKLLHEVLSPHGHCDQAFDGEEAIDAVRLALEDGRPYDLIMLDIMMPKTDGHQALDKIRQMEFEHGIYGSDQVKVVMATALVDAKHCIQSFREGCESYVTKPLRPKQVIQQVRDLLGESMKTLPGESEFSATTPAASEEFGIRCLIVDDSNTSRELLRAMLRPHAQCSFAYDGREAVDAVRLAMDDGQPFDLIFMDIMMPGMDGHEALRSIRALESERGVRGSDCARVIMTTALADSKHCMKSFREGCECYLTKPVSEDQLFAKMRELGLSAEKDRTAT